MRDDCGVADFLFSKYSFLEDTVVWRNWILEEVMFFFRRVDAFFFAMCPTYEYLEDDEHLNTASFYRRF